MDDDREKFYAIIVGVIGLVALAVSLYVVFPH